MQDLNKFRNALKEIVEVANSALILESKESETADVQRNEITSSVSCTIKSLPNRLLQKAAQTAIKINPHNAPVSGSKLELAVEISKYWGTSPRVLTVSFMERTPEELSRRILGHMNAWSKTVCISFAQTEHMGHVRISRGGGGYWSYLGTDIMHIPKYRPTMNLEGFTNETPESEFVRVVRHETGHTLGFPHEHMRRELVNRIDPEKAYQYFLRSQGWNRSTVDQQVLTPLDDSSIMRTPADQDSIMCYHLPGTITKDGKPITGGKDINQSDYNFAGSIYPKTQRSSVGESMAEFTPYQKNEVAEWLQAEDVSEEEILEALLETTKSVNGVGVAN